MPRARRGQARAPSSASAPTPQSGFAAIAVNERVRARVGDARPVLAGEVHVGVDVADVADDAGAVSVTVEWSDEGLPPEERARLVL